jgi:hypothetical protein
LRFAAGTSPAHGRRSYGRSLANPIEGNASNRLKSVEGGPQSAPFRESQAIQCRSSYSMPTISQIGTKRRGFADAGLRSDAEVDLGTNNGNFLQYEAGTLRQNENRLENRLEMRVKPSCQGGES